MKKILLLCTTASCIVPAAALIAPTAAYAQETTSSVRGQVVSNNAPVANAAVTVTHVPSGTVSRTTSDATGNFSATGLRVGGPYTIQVAAEGFERAAVTDVFLRAGEPVTLPVDLGAASASGEEIVVTANRSQARERSNGPITTLNREEIEGVASVNRDIRDLARRDPFVTMDPTNSRTIEVAGNNGRLNRFSVDGVQFSDDFGLNNGGLPTSRGPVPFDAIEQFSVKVAPYDIAEGDFQGGAVNVILRSGTNKFRGSAFYSYSGENMTGDKIDGQDVDLEFSSKQYGAVVSGPIIPNRLFFMLGYEKLKETDPFEDGVGTGFANQVPGITLAQVDQVSSIANSVYNYDTLGLIQNAVEEDEKIVAKLDWNVTDDHRASFTYVRNVGTQQNQQNTFTTPPYALGLQSNGYEAGEEVNSGVFQLNSDWTDIFSTELRASYRDYNRDQTPFGGREFAQFGVCLDPTSVGSGTSCAGSRIFFGPDISRQSNDLRTDNLSVDFTPRLALGSHSLKGLIGYTKINTFNLFLQRSLGDVYFDSIADFQMGRANRIQLGGAVPSLDPNDAAADFYSEAYTLGLQDDWEVSDQLQLNAGIRWDIYEGANRPPLNPNFLARYGFDNRETFKGRSLLQPRFGFNYRPAERLVVRGGTGVFGGGTPDVFLSNSFSNTGLLTNALSITRNSSAAGCDVTTAGTTAAQRLAICNSLNNVDGRTFPSALTGFLATNTASLATAPTNAIDPDLDIASQWRSSLSVNYEANLGGFGDGWLFGADLLYSKVLNAYQWTDIRSVQIGTLPDGRPRYGPFGGVASSNQDLLMTNESKGRSIIGVLRFAKNWDFGLSLDGSYTRSDVKDTNALTSSTAGSLYSNNAFFDPNRAAYGRSIYEIRDQWKLGADYRRAFFGDYETRFSLFGEYRSGRPYSITGFNPGGGRLSAYGTVGNAARVLLYVPEMNDPRVVFDSLQSETAFNALVDDLGLEKYRGRVVPKNSQTSPKFVKLDLHLSQEVPALLGRSRFKVFADVENVLNLINSDWGALRQASFPYTQAIVNVECAQLSGSNCTQYRYSNVTPPNETLNARQSLYQIRVGARFEF